VERFGDIAGVDGLGLGPIVAVALHAGHRVRPELAVRLAASDADRLREEDPYTEIWAGAADVTVVARRSRFEVDLNRTRERAVYREPGDTWGLTVWRSDPTAEMIARSLELYDAFYAGMRALLDCIVERYGRFVVLDVHSYNHRRAGCSAAYADPLGNPELNVGTAGLDPVAWGPVRDRFVDMMQSQAVGGRALDVRENVRFKGGCFMRWVNATYGGVGCALALEWKKTFMDEWTGRADPRRVYDVAHAFARTVPELRTALYAR
jgi:N-formylglutamate deformylase